MYNTVNPNVVMGSTAGLTVRARAGGLMLEERYNISTLSRFTKVASLEHCSQQCNYMLDSNVLLASLEHELLVRSWKNFKDQNVSRTLSSHPGLVCCINL